jgi:hypothetical protein
MTNDDDGTMKVAIALGASYLSPDIIRGRTAHRADAHAARSPFQDSGRSSGSSSDFHLPDAAPTLTRMLDI